MIYVPQKRIAQPQYPVGIKEEWRELGVHTVWNLAPALGFREVISGTQAQINGSHTQTPQGIITGGTASDYIVLPLNKATAHPVSIVAVNREISGTVFWSSLASNAVWYGYYQQGINKLTTSNNNSFDGELIYAPSGRDPYSAKALSFGTANTLQGVCDGGPLITDATSQIPAQTNSRIALGVSLLDVAANPSIAEHLLYIVADQAWPEEILRKITNNPWQIFQPISRKIWVASAGAILASTTKAGAWSVRNLAAQTQAGAFSVRNLVGTTQASAWSVRNLASQTQAGAWSVRNLAATTQAGAWSVAATGIASAVQAGSWSVRNIVSTSQAGAFSVRNLSAQTQAGSWSVRNSVSATKAGGWTVYNSAASTQAGAWKVWGYAAGTQAGSWSVGGSIITLPAQRTEYRNTQTATRNNTQSARRPRA